MAPAPLKFIVAPHIVQDLGLNLYTDLPRVLVEFVANAYDADSPDVTLAFDHDKIEAARQEIKAAYKKKAPSAIPLEEMVLPDGLTIEIEDRGHGMNRDDLQTRFLVAGRRRREADGTKDNPKTRSDGGRLFMGRKGLGKLAGFGVGKQVDIVTKTKGATHCTKITLDYAELVKKTTTDDIVIPDVTLPADAIKGDQGTKIIISKLLYGPMQSRETTVAAALSEHFMFIDPGEFGVIVNGHAVPPFTRNLVFAWPDPDKPITDFVPRAYDVEGVGTVSFHYRLRFTGDSQSLKGKERGVRVYAHSRLASVPSLLNADTNMHGFRMTDYLDGVVKADFLDDQPSDYVATDRQTLRWDTPLLKPLYDLLSLEIKEACKHYQQHRDEHYKEEVKVHQFTADLIDAAGLSQKHTRMAYKIAAIIASSCKQGKDDAEYKRQLPIVVKGLGHGQILGAIAALAKETLPPLDKVVAEITALAKDEIDQQLSYITGRLHSIEALRKIVNDRDFATKRNEKALQHLFEEAPWLINAMFFQFLSADKNERTMQSELEKALQINKHTPKGYSPQAADETKPGGANKRPDLVFVLGNSGLHHVVIVELKAPNTPLYGAHLRQLQGYMDRTNQWFEERQEKVKVEGILIGSLAKLDAQADDVRWLRREMDQAGPRSPWKVLDLSTVLNETEQAHRELLDMQKDN